MRRMLFCALLVLIAPASLLTAQSPDSTLASLSDLTHRGQLSQAIDAANSLLATGNLTLTDQGIVLIYRGYAWQQRGEFTKATADYEKALAVINRDGQHPSDYAGALAALATAYAEIGQIDTAKHVFVRSVHLFEDQGNHTGAAIIWNDLATIAAEEHSRRDARKYMAQSIAESQLASDITPGERAALAATEGRIAELDGDSRTAIADYQRSIDLWESTHGLLQQQSAWLYVLLGGAYLQAGDIANARQSTTRGLTLLQASSGTQTPRYFAAQLAYSKVLDAAGAHDEASTIRKQAQTAMNTTDQQHPKSTISINALR